MKSVLYRKTQPGTAIVIAMAIGLAVAAAVTVIGHVAPVPQLTIAAVLTCIGIAFSSMTIEISEDSVAWSLAFGLFRRSIFVSDIALAVTKRVSLLNGLGIRTNGRDWLWVVSGGSAVTLELRDGRRISLGSDDAERVASLINDRIALR